MSLQPALGALTEAFGGGPAVVSEAGGHRGYAGPRLPVQAQVRSHNVVVPAPPVKLSLEAGGGLGRGPGAAGEGGDPI